MSRFDFIATPIGGLVLIQRRLREDARGWISRFFCAEEFYNAGLLKPIQQINYTLTRKKGAVRGLHFQYPPHSEVKVVSCLGGRVFDVAVDVRRDSSTFLQWYGEELSKENCRSLLIPEGFAHGFQALTEDCELLYLHTAPYVPEAEGALDVLDPRLAIRWPLDVSDLSDRDRSHPHIGEGYSGLEL